jgi:predicted transcriptional regulator
MVKEETALDNEIRRMIFNHIMTYPGVTFNILKNIFGLTDGGLRYHLDYLEKCDKISTGVDKGIRCYYPNQNSVNVPKSSSEVLEPYKLTPQQEHILDVIKLNPGLNQKELVIRTRMNRFQVSKNLKKLMNLNVVRPYKNSRNTCYEYIPDEELKFKIIKRLVMKLLRDEIDEVSFLKLVKELD